MSLENRVTRMWTWLEAGDRKLRAPRILLLAAILIIMLARCSGPNPELEKLSVGLPALEQNALLYVADDQKLFAQQGLEITLREYDSGVTAFDAMQRGEVQLAEGAEFPFVRAILERSPMVIIVSNDKFENDYLVAREDRGIHSIGDLKGKRVGVALKSINEFFLGRFLDLNGIPAGEVKSVDVKPGEFEEALATGSVDALVAWQPYVHQIREQSDYPLVVWPAQSNQAVYGIVVSNPAWVAEHRSTVERFLRALARAQDYVVKNPQHTRAILQERLHYDQGYMDSVWSQHQFTLSLDFSLLVALNDEARWLIRQNATTGKTVPNWLDNIYLDGLKAVEPAAVNIIR